jgi:pilus assembly protein CpaB
MNRRTRHVVVLAVAILTASLASLGVYRATAGRPNAAAGPTLVPVVVAAHELAIGTLVTERDVRVVQWPATSVVPGAMGSVKEVVNRGLLAAVLPNEPLTGNKLAAQNDGAGLPPAIPAGMRAMAVKVNEVIGVAGFIVPGSRVDVVVTMRRSNDSVTSTVASNVQVLTSGTRRDQERPAAASQASSTDTTVVTLMVSPQDAERIALAQSEGQIMLSLRNPNDRAPTVSAGVRTGALLAQSEPPAPAPAPKPTAPRRVVSAPPPAPEVVTTPKPRTIETIRAAKRSEEPIKEVIK